MARYARVALVLAACAAGGLVPAQEKNEKKEPAAPNSRVQFRWMEPKPVEGVTEAKGVQTSCDPDDLSYPHLKPVLTVKDIASATLKYYDLRKSNIGEQWDVKFQITEEGRKRLVDEAGGKRKFI